MTSYTVTTGSSDFPSKALLACTICSKYESQGNAPNHKRCFSTSYTITYYTQKQTISDTNISNVITPYFTTEFCALLYNDLPL